MPNAYDDYGNPIRLGISDTADNPCPTCAILRARAEKAEAQLCRILEVHGNHWTGRVTTCAVCAEAEKVAPCPHEEEVARLREDIVQLHNFAETHAEVERIDAQLIAKWAGEAEQLREAYGLLRELWNRRAQGGSVPGRELNTPYSGEREKLHKWHTLDDELRRRCAPKEGT